MTGAEPLPPAVLKRKAVVYVRQSTPAQVETNLESRRRQYELVDVARSRGFRDVEVIDDDLGRSASGMVARPGFERLVAWLRAGVWSLLRSWLRPHRGISQEKLPGYLGFFQVVHNPRRRGKALLGALIAALVR